jgi:hypothetical protein
MNGLKPPVYGLLLPLRDRAKTNEIRRLRRFRRFGSQNLRHRRNLRMTAPLAPLAPRGKEAGGRRWDSTWKLRASDALSPNGAKSYSPGRSGAQAWVSRPVIDAAPTGRNKSHRDPTPSQVTVPPGGCVTRRVSRPFRAFSNHASDDPGLRKAFALGFRIRPIQGQEIANHSRNFAPIASEIVYLRSADRSYNPRPFFAGGGR